MSPNSKNFLFLGNQRCIDFVNTEVINQGGKLDLLASFSDLLSWMVAAKMMAPTQALRVENDWSSAQSLAALDRAKGFRGRMRNMIDQLAHGKALPQKAVSEINDKLRAGSAFLQVVKKGRGFERKLERDFTEPAQLLARLADSAADLLCNCELS